jgi:hypothetical protein
MSSPGLDCCTPPSGCGDALARLAAAEWDAWLRRCDRARLEAALAAIEMRLGTAAERTNDLDHVRAIAHELNNRITIDRLRGAPDA